MYTHTHPNTSSCFLEPVRLLTPIFVIFGDRSLASDTRRGPGGGVNVMTGLEAARQVPKLGRVVVGVAFREIIIWMHLFRRRLPPGRFSPLCHHRRLQKKTFFLVSASVTHPGVSSTNTEAKFTPWLCSGINLNRCNLL